MVKKHDVSRPYPPDYVSRKTLAYLLDCAPSSIDKLVKGGHVPEGIGLGNLERWDRLEVRRHIAERRADGDQNGANPFLAGVQTLKAVDK